MEMMETEMEDSFDSSFVMNVFANNGRTSRKAIEQYLKIKNRDHISFVDNLALYQGLLNILANRKYHDNRGQEQAQRGKRIMLM